MEGGFFVEEENIKNLAYQTDAGQEWGKKKEGREKLGFRGKNKFELQHPDLSPTMHITMQKFIFESKSACFTKGFNFNSSSSK